MKKLILSILFLFFVSPCFATMDTVLMGGTTDPLLANGTEYLRVITGGNTWGATERFQVVPSSGTIKALRVKLSAAITSGTYDFTLRVNGADSTLTCQVTSQTCTDLSHQVSVSAGDRVSLKSAGSSADGTPGIYWSMLFTGGDNVSILLLSSNSTTTSLFTNLSGSFVGDGTESDMETPIPTGGEFKDLYVWVSTAPGDGKTITVTLRKAQADTALTCTITGAGVQTCSDTNAAHAVSATAGNLFDFSITSSGTPTAPYYSIGIVFSPTTNGESLQLYADDDAPGDDEYAALNVNPYSLGWLATEADAQEMTQSATVKNLYVKLDTAPSAGDARTFTLYQNGSPASVTCTIAETATTCNDTAHTLSASAGDLLSTRHDITNAPTSVVGMGIGYVTYIEPTSATIRRIIMVN